MASLPPVPVELKFISPYLQRAQELLKREPIIAYYCNYYAAKLAIAKPTKSKESTAFLATLLDVLEAEKKNLGDNEAITNDIAGSAYVENFGLKIFLNADNEDRLGKASKKTAKTFLAASIFLELLYIFGDMEPEIEEKIKYAKWKAANIVKAINNGEAPVPGPPGGDPNIQLQQETDSVNIDSRTHSNDVPEFDQFPSAPLSSISSLHKTEEDPWASFPSPPSQNQQPLTHYDPFIGDNPDVKSQLSTLIVTPFHPTIPSPKSNEFYSPIGFPSNTVIGLDPFPSTTSTPSSLNLPSTSSNNLYYDQNQLNVQQPSFFSNDSVHQPSQQRPQLHGPISPAPPPQLGFNKYVTPPYQQPTPSSNVHSFQTHTHVTNPQTPHNYRNIPEIDASTIAIAQKHSKWAISALNYSDVKTAMDNLRKAIALLEPYNENS
ncbi:hypothetical protein G9A89_016815 [Geosiphon pyriformis]|nr:hypothetical protein G9A89_016815 [Geosiphon pyriformis]